MQRQKADFSLVLASSVHDMKNSLGMLLNSLEEVIETTPAKDKEQAKRFASLQYQASRINIELIQLLSLYRLQSDHWPLREDEHYLVEVLEEQVARNDMLFRTRELEVSIVCEEELRGYFDAELVGGVIHNVLVNGVRYSRSKLRLEAIVEGDHLIISVADDGDGYPEFMLGNLHTSFTQPVNLSEGNTHLGLYFAQQVASLHQREDRQGNICLSNGGALGGGVFQLLIPV